MRWNSSSLIGANRNPAIRSMLLRLLLAWPSFFLFGAGYLWVLVDRDHTAVHDRLSGTRVVLLPKEFQPLK